jgi:fructose/tagatose bisphosphate aldolase
MERFSGALKDARKVAARLSIERLEQLESAAGIPLVLHGGSGVRQEYLLKAFRHGMAKINVGTEIRQAYEAAWRATGDVSQAQQATYERTIWVLRDMLQVSGSRSAINP